MSRAVPEGVRVGEHIDHEARIDAWLKAGWWREGVEGEWRQWSPGRVDVHLLGEVWEEVSCGAFPVQEHKRNPLPDELFEQVKRDIRLACS